MQNINEIEELVKLISKLPGLGPKSAKRIVLKLIKYRYRKYKRIDLQLIAMIDDARARLLKENNQNINEK